MLDIRSTLGFAQGTQMISGCDPLPQLFEPRTTECRAELGLTEEKALQRHRPVKNDVGQHAQLFQRLEGQVLRLVNDQKHTFTVAMLSQYELANALQQRPLGEPFFDDAKSGCDHMKKVIAGELGRDDLRRDETASIDGRQQIFDEDRFACPDFTGNNDETLGMAKSIDQISHRLAVNRALEKEASIRSELERLRGKSIKFSVHRRLRMSC